MTFITLPGLLRASCVVGLVATLGVPANAADEPTATADQVRFFETQIRPVLAESCNGCHGATKVKAGLRLDSRRAVLAGGDSGAAVVPGDPANSPLIAAIRYEGPEMPPKGKLPAKQVEALTRWVQMGAPWPKGAEEPGVPAEATEPASNIRKPGYAGDRRRSFAHWSFRPLVTARPVRSGNGVPPGRSTRFLAARPGGAKHLAANPPATQGELIRRATYDLTGLPPTPAEVGRSSPTPRPEAYPRLIDRLLASPRYGEKWGRHWLDLVRYAETNSYERDGLKPNAWRYRDYVIRSIFNADKPYDQFIREQLAGDETARGRASMGKIATGYYRLGPLGRRARRPRPGPLRRVRRHRRDHRPGLPRPDRRLRPLPRPQARPDPAEGLLPLPLVLPERQRLPQRRPDRRGPFFIGPTDGPRCLRRSRPGNLKTPTSGTRSQATVTAIEQ